MRRIPALMITSCLTLVLVLLMSLAALAVAPTEEAYEIWRQQGVLDQKIANWQAFKAAGGCSPSPSPFDPSRRATRLAAGINAPDTLPVLVIMVDFSDNMFPGGAVIGTADLFDSVLFSDKLSGGRVNASGSMIDYYREASYGAIKIKGAVFGPFHMDSSYSWYVGEDDGFTRSPQLAYDAVTKANPTVNFQQWAYNGMVQGVIILHPGGGAETGTSNAIWSHKSTVNPSAFYDGVSIATYTVCPEEYGNALQPIGVFCHEHGHVLGLPDLYDINPTHVRSEGLGFWSLMASGNYNGGSRYPAHPDPWCKIKLGWITQAQVNNVTSNTVHVPIPAVEYNPVVYKIRGDTNVALSEYWLIENRQRKGSDFGLPGAGLLIYHIDPARTGWKAPNIDTLHYGVGLEQADGLDQLALDSSRGDAADPWPGSTNNRNFTDQSVPNSRLYAGTTTEVGAWNISNSDSIMTADLDYSFSRPYITFDRPDSIIVREAVGGNGDGIFDNGETIEFFCRINNTMRDAFGWSMTLATSNRDVEFLTNHVRQGKPGDTRILQRVNNPNVANVPVTFRLKPGSIPSYTTFTLTVRTDSMYNSSDEKFSKSFQFTIALGTPNVLVVDDDNGTKSDSVIGGVFRRLNVPTKTWSKAAQGSPSGATLSAFGTVFWVHGKKPTGTLTAADVTALKAFLNGNGNLCMASATAAKQLATLDSAFLSDYLHARFIDTTSGVAYFFGLNDGHMGDSIKVKYTGTQPQQQFIALAQMTNVAPVAPGIKAFTGSDRFNGAIIRDTVGVTYAGTYKTVLLTFPIEFLTDAELSGGWMPRDTIIQRILGFFGVSTTWIDNPDAHRLPENFTLEQNFPNPFNPSTIITYSLNPIQNGRPATVDLSVYNLLGEKIVTLVDRAQRPGNYAVEWNGSNGRGAKVASGVYFYRLTYGEQSATRKMLLLK